MKIGTRESQLAMAQTNEFKELFEEEYSDIDCEVVGITSLGDKDLKTELKDMGGEGVFVRELDEALLNGSIDVTVNSLKDIPINMDPRLVVAAVLPRADPRDACIPFEMSSLACGAFVGTSSVRRERMLKVKKPGVKIMPIRGNMNTRLQKLENGEYSALVMAKAGLDRLGIERNVFPISKEDFIPAAGQGAIAIECRADDTETIELLKKLDHTRTRREITAEREVLRIMNAGCSSPIGVNAEIKGKNMRMLAISFCNEWPIRVDMTFPLSETDQKVKEVANKLMGIKG